MRFRDISFRMRFKASRALGLYSVVVLRGRNVWHCWFSLHQRAFIWAFLRGTLTCFGYEIHRVRGGCQDQSALVKCLHLQHFSGHGCCILDGVQDTVLIKENWASPRPRYISLTACMTTLNCIYLCWSGGVSLHTWQSKDLAFCESCAVLCVADKRIFKSNNNYFSWCCLEDKSSIPVFSPTPPPVWIS